MFDLVPINIRAVTNIWSSHKFRVRMLYGVICVLAAIAYLLKFSTIFSQHSDDVIIFVYHKIHRESLSCLLVWTHWYICGGFLSWKSKTAKHALVLTCVFYNIVQARVHGFKPRWSPEFFSGLIYTIAIRLTIITARINLAVVEIHFRTFHMLNFNDTSLALELFTGTYEPTIWKMLPTSVAVIATVG